MVPPFWISCYKPVYILPARKFYWHWHSRKHLRFRELKCSYRSEFEEEEACLTATVARKWWKISQRLTVIFRLDCLCCLNSTSRILTFPVVGKQWSCSIFSSPFFFPIKKHWLERALSGKSTDWKEHWVERALAPKLKTPFSRVWNSLHSRHSCIRPTSHTFFKFPADQKNFLSRKLDLSIFRKLVGFCSLSQQNILINEAIFFLRLCGNSPDNSWHSLPLITVEVSRASALQTSKIRVAFSCKTYKVRVKCWRNTWIYAMTEIGVERKILWHFIFLFICNCFEMALRECRRTLLNQKKHVDVRRQIVASEWPCGQSGSICNECKDSCT